MRPLVQSFHHHPTNSFSHVVHDRPGGEAVIIDPVLDFDARSCRTSTQFADSIREFVRAHRLQVRWILETHSHADHITAAAYLASILGCGVGISHHVEQVIAAFRPIFDLAASCTPASTAFQWLIEDGETFQLGALTGKVVHTPGHTADSVTYLIGDAAFVGDLIFMPDCGTGRCDFPGGSATSLYRSLQRLLSLPESTRLFLGHDYPPPGRAATGMTTVAAQKASNVHVTQYSSEQEFAAFRRARDATLPLPALLVPAIQLNVRGGSLPAPSPNGQVYLKLPVNVL